MQIVDNSFARVTYYAEGHYIEFHYKRFGTSAEFRDAWTQAGMFAAKNKVTRWLSDSRKMAVIKPEDQKWFSEELSPKVRSQMPGKDVHAAILLDAGVFAQVSMKNIVDGLQKVRTSADGQMIAVYFKDEAAAKEWLLNPVLTEK